MAEAIKKPVPAYVSFTTLRNFLDLIRTEGVPPVVDHSMLRHMSGATSSQLRTALKYLGATDDEGNTEEILEELARAKDEDRHVVMAKILKSAYSFLFDGSDDFDLEKGTFRQFDEKFRDQGASGATVVKAERFFLQAADYAQIPISAYITKGMKTRRTPPKAPKKRTPVVDKKQEKKQVEDQRANEQNQNGSQHLTGQTFAQFLDSAQYPILSAYFSQLPEDGVWENEDKKMQWLKGIEMALGFETSVDDEDEYYDEDEDYE